MKALLYYYGNGRSGDKRSLKLHRTGRYRHQQ